MKCTLKTLFFYCLIVKISSCTPSDQDTKQEVTNYLQSFGYLPTSETQSKITHKQLHAALKELQTYGHIQKTGKIDESTLALIKVPRCGVPDIVRGRRRQKRYDLLSTKWEKHHITWTFDSKNGQFYYESQKIRRVIAEALNVWSSNSVLTFEEVSEPESADIVISFEAPYHSSIDPFPMENDILGHAFRPGAGLGGDVHLSEDLEWDFNVLYGEQPSRGARSFFAVILHELGHSIGLDHSRNPNAVMYFSYSKTTGILSADDIEGIQHIYGVPRRRNENQATTHSPSNDDQENDFEVSKIPDKCETSYDAIALIRNELFIFKGIYMWRPKSNSDAIEIRKMWEFPDLLTHVDAVFEKEDGTILFFVGREIYAFSGTTFVYRSSLSHLGIDHHFEKIDAIFKWNYNKRTYIFSGDQYWKLDGDFVDRHYPKDILRSWRDVYDVDTAFSNDEALYFFKGMSFYRFNHRTMRINRMNPQSTAHEFMRCPIQRRMFKLANRFGDELNVDVIDNGRLNEFPEDEDNIEKLDEKSENDAKTKNTSDDALKYYPTFPIFLASLAISRVLPSILLHF